jgi:cystathionine beta-synthase
MKGTKMNTVQTFQVSTRLQDLRPQVFENILQTIGQTPLVRLNKVNAEACMCTVLAKVEFFNPGGSVKDRIGLSIIEKAERDGILHPGGTIVEATSGNTGAGLAMAAAVKGYKCVFVMPDKMSDEKIRLLRAFGARVVITPTSVAPEDPRSYYNIARRIVEETPNSFLANQYHNPANPEAHYCSSGPELWEQTCGQIDVFVAGMGTGGTITGVGRFLKEMNPEIKLVGVDIVGSLLYDAWKAGRIPEEVFLKTYKIEGIGEDFIPSTLDLSLIDEVVQVNDRESFLMARRLMREEAIFCGGSSGSAVAGLLKSEIVRALQPGQTVVVLLPDSGNRYLSKMFDDNWMRENGFLEPLWSEMSIADLLASRQNPALITVNQNDHGRRVIALMKQHNISQVPVIDQDGKLIGIVTEVELLKRLLDTGCANDPEETVAALVNSSFCTAGSRDKLGKVLDAFDRGMVVFVVEGERPVGILTKIDVIDLISQNTAKM